MILVVEYAQMSSQVVLAQVNNNEQSQTEVSDSQIVGFLMIYSQMTFVCQWQSDASGCGWIGCFYSQMIWQFMWQY